MADAVQHCQRAWWQRPPVWFIVIAAVLVLAFVIFEMAGRPAATPYGTFLDQLDAGNVASVTFQGTEISGRFKHPPVGSPTNSPAQQDTFLSHTPDFGDPTLIAELRKQHVAIDVKSQSQWLSLLGRLPWPMVLFVGVLLIAGVVRLVRGGKPQTGAAMSMHPMGGMMGLISGLFRKQDQVESPTTGGASDTPSKAGTPRSH